MRVVFSLRKSEPNSCRPTKELVKEIELKEDFFPATIDNSIQYNEKSYDLNNVSVILSDDGQLTRKYIFVEYDV